MRVRPPRRGRFVGESIEGNNRPRGAGNGSAVRVRCRVGALSRDSESKYTRVMHVASARYAAERRAYVVSLVGTIVFAMLGVAAALWTGSRSVLMDGLFTLIGVPIAIVSMVVVRVADEAPTSDFSPRAYPGPPRVEYRSIRPVYTYTMKTRERLIATTSEVIKRKGYFGTGISEVLAAVGAPKGSLYHHFPSGNDELIREAVVHGGRSHLRRYGEALRGNGCRRACTPS